MCTFSNPVTSQIVEFLGAIGIPVVAAQVSGAVLPGIRIEKGSLVVDETQLVWPGDLLHEAAHLAMVPAALRETLAEDAGNDGGEELGAIAWSWAAISHLGLDAEIVFHSGGYRGGSRSIIENFREGHYIGVPFLRWIGLTGENYPAMIQWLRD
jgi:hypothetical protein